MSWPPYLLKLRVKNSEHDFGFWLPLFLLWPLVLVFLLAAFIILLPFAILSVVFTIQSEWLETLLMAVPGVFRIFANLSGMVIDVGGSQEHVYIEFR